jgi:O-antigen/teichoic acid export membrane protein
MNRREKEHEARIGRNVRAVFLGNSLYALGLWLQTVIFARQGGPAAVGAYAFAVALVTPVMMLSHLHLRTLLASDVRNKYTFQEYRRLRLVTTAVGMVSLFAAAWGTGQWRTIWPVLAPVCVKAGADAVSDIYSGLWQQVERMNVVARALILQAGSSVTLMVVTALLGGSVSALATAAALGSCTQLVYLHLRTTRDPALRWRATASQAGIERRRLLQLAREAVPLGLIVLLVSLQQYVPRYIIRLSAGETALGLFAAASQLTSTGTIIIQALGTAAIPHLARAYADSDLWRFRKLTRKLVLHASALGVAGVLASALLGREVLIVVFRPEFAGAASTLLVLSVSAGLSFIAVLLGYSLTAARVIIQQTVLLSATLVVSMVGCALLVPLYGIVGAAAGLLVAALVQAVGNAVAVVRCSGDARPRGDVMRSERVESEGVAPPT